MSTTAGTKPTFLRKPPTAVRNYAVDFGSYYELRVGGETLTGTPTPTVSVSPAGPTLSAAAVSGTEVQFTISGGTTNTTYTLTVTVSTSGGSTLVSHPELRVETF